MIDKENIHYRGFTIKFLKPTNTKGSRIRISDERFEQSKIIDYRHEYNHTLDQAINYLTDNGFKIVGYSEMRNYYIVFCDNWGNDIIELKNIK